MLGKEKNDMLNVKSTVPNCDRLSRLGNDNNIQEKNVHGKRRIGGVR